MDGSRPLDPDRWRDHLGTGAEEQILGAIETLRDFPVLDGTVQRIIAIADDPDTTTADLVGCLEADPTFAANLLRYANSAAMARPIRAKTVRPAVMLVRRPALRRLALEAATYRFFEKAPGTGSARGELHVHAIAVASVAAATAEQVRAPRRRRRRPPRGGRHGRAGPRPRRRPPPRRPAARHGQAPAPHRLRRRG